MDGDRGRLEHAEKALQDAADRGGLVVCGAVFAELLAAPGRSEDFIRQFCLETGIEIDWHFSEAIWVSAGRAFQGYANRRKRQKSGLPRRILADFLIGAHATEKGHELLTLDAKLFNSAFPGIQIVKL
ncbi:MAG: type II toxin-antitoxin system VapC family toxin [Acidobacteria bacterium]|nr:type II toxin-antitoxin system VapC family toxin [Acidobacteriota bacterium]